MRVYSYIGIFAVCSAAILPAWGQNQPSPQAQAPGAPSSPGIIGGGSPDANPSTATPAAPTAGSAANDPSGPNPTPGAAMNKYTPWKWHGFNVDAFDIALQETVLGVSGSSIKLDQYDTPAQGIFIPRMFLFGGHPGDGEIVMDLVQPGRANQNLFVQYFTPGKPGTLRFYDSTWSEHPQLTSFSVNRNTRGVGLNQTLWKGVVLRGNLYQWTFTPDSTLNLYPLTTALLYPSYSLSTANLGVQIPFGSQKLLLRFAKDNFQDRTTTQPGNTTDQGSVVAQADLTRRASAKAAYSYSATSVDYRPTQIEGRLNHTNISRTARLDVQGAPLDSVALRAYVIHTNDSRGFNDNGYASMLNSSGLQVSWRGIRGLYMRTGYEYRNTDYNPVDRPGFYHPQMQTFFASGRYTPFRKLEFTGRYSNVRRSGLPPSPRFENTVFELPVTPTDSTNIQMGVNYTPSPFYGVGYQFVQQRDVNPVRSMIYAIQLQDVIGWAQPTNNLSVSLSLGQHRQTSGFLSAYLTNSQVLTGGFSYTVNRRAFLSASYTYNESTGSSQVTDNGANVSAHYQFNPYNEAVVEYISDSFRDQISTPLGYDMTGVNLRWRHRL